MECYRVNSLPVGDFHKYLVKNYNSDAYGYGQLMDILVVDLETAAHDPNKSDLRDLNNSLIIEVGIVLANLETGKIEPVFNQVCREDRACSS